MESLLFAHKRRHIKTMELFGGVGSPRVALRNIGIPVKSVDYVEIDEKAVRSYNSMFLKDLYYVAQDVRGYNLALDILIHGSPCQSFSIAGKQEGADEGSNTESSLMWETLEIIRNLGNLKPKVVIWENVTNVLSGHMVHNFNKYLGRMEELGYTNSYEVLNAMDFGLPQNRNRVFVISILGDEEFDFSDLIRQPMRPIGEFLEFEHGNACDERYVVKSPSMVANIGKPANPKFNGFLKIIENDGYAETITTKQDRNPNSGIIPIGNGQYRLLTERECWRLQGYSDQDYEAALKANKGRKGFKNGTLYKQAGNSIPVTIFESIFRKILLGEAANK